VGNITGIKLVTGTTGNVRRELVDALSARRLERHV
jgi:hypothetical protein